MSRTNKEPELLINGLPVTIFARSLEGANASILITDASQNLVYVNPTFTQETGYRADEVLGRNPRFFQGIDSEPQAIQNIRATLANGENVHQIILNYTRDGTPLWFHLHISPLFENGKLTHFVGVQENITALKEAQTKLEATASTDALTGLQNRRAFDAALYAEHARSVRHNREFSLIVLDLDGFKPINDTLGHLAGDAILHGVGTVLMTDKRGADGVYRIGGDEFALILPETNAEGAAKVSSRIRNSIARVMVAGLGVGASVGVATFPMDASDLTGLFQIADERMYAIKSSRPDRKRSGADET